MQLLPIYDSKNNDKFAFPFESPSKITEDQWAVSGALRFGITVDLLILSTSEALIEAGVQSKSDLIDQRNFIIDKIYYRLHNTDQCLETTEKEFPALHLRHDGDHKKTLHGVFNIKIDSKDGREIPPFGIYATADPVTGKMLVTHSPCSSIELLGYSIKANRYNPESALRREPQMEFTPAILSELDVGSMVCRNSHGHQAFQVWCIGKEAKSEHSDPVNKWVVLNDEHFFKVQGNHFVSGLWMKKPPTSQH